MDFAVDDGVCLDPNLFRRTYDMESIGSEQPVRVSTEVAVRSTKRHLSRFSRRALFVVELALTFLKFVCNTLQITPSKAINLGGNCQGKPFLGGDR
ncbi:hypothetical protein HK102_004655 [Quaeritorhiza haematococci]|nr:hypothetical protein HK102_004655 [Quaeritorhiza haematococci]